MQGISTHNLLKMQFERLALSEDFRKILGDLPSVFMAGIIGESGHGKTEWCQQFATELARFGPVDWLAYETGFAADIQDAVRRNNSEKQNYPITWVNPWKKIQPCKKDFPLSKDKDVNLIFGDFVNRLAKHKSAKYVIVDSIDRTHFTVEQMMWLYQRYAEKKGIIFIVHGESQGKKPISAVGGKVLFYSNWSLRVHNYIAYPRKSRFSATECYVVWEQRAKELEPEFFGIVPTLKAKKTGKRKKRTAKRKSTPTPKGANENDSL